MASSFCKDFHHSPNFGIIQYRSVYSSQLDQICVMSCLVLCDEQRCEEGYLLQVSYIIHIMCIIQYYTDCVLYRLCTVLNTLSKMGSQNLAQYSTSRFLASFHIPSSTILQMQLVSQCQYESNFMIPVKYNLKLIIEVFRNQVPNLDQAIFLLFAKDVLLSRQPNSNIVYCMIGQYLQFSSLHNLYSMTASILYSV